MKVRPTSVSAADPSRASRLSKGMLGFEARGDVPVGAPALASPDGREGIEQLLEPNDHPYQESGPSP